MENTSDELPDYLVVKSRKKLMSPFYDGTTLKMKSLKLSYQNDGANNLYNRGNIGGVLAGLPKATRLSYPIS